MNDLDQVRELRSDVGEPSVAQLARGRAKLLEAVAAAPIRRTEASRLRLGRRVFLPVGVLGTAAAVAATGIVVFGGGTAAAPGHSAPSVPSVNLTAQLLNEASVTAAAQTVVEPGAGQWIFSKFTGYQYPQATTSSVNWMTFDGYLSAYYDDGMFGGKLTVHRGIAAPASTGNGLDDFEADPTPFTAYNALASLPTDPAALLAAAAAEMVKSGDSGMGAVAGAHATQNVNAAGRLVGPPSPQEEFDFLVQLLWNSAQFAPPTAVAAVFRTMATLPGITSQQNITDVINRPAVGISADGGVYSLLLDPATYRILGFRELSRGPDDLKAHLPRNPQGAVKGQLPTSWPAKGQVVESDALAQITLVSGPGKTS